MMIEYMPVPVLRCRQSSPDAAWIVVHDPGDGQAGTISPRRLDLVFRDVHQTSVAEAIACAIVGRRPDAFCRVVSSLRPHRLPCRPHMKADAVRDASFVDRLPEGVDTLLVGCEYGRSRSRAIAEWAGRRLGAAVVGDTSGTANRRLERLLEEVASTAYATGPE